MRLTNQELWERFTQHYFEEPKLGLALDLSRLNLSPDFFARLAPKMEKAFSAMAELEKGAIANPDEDRMVGHYWLRNSSLAPTPEIRTEIDRTLASIEQFAADVHSGKIRGERTRFERLLVIGIGGSALGPQFVSHALSQPGKDKLAVSFLDNTDPDGMDKVFASLQSDFDKSLCLVISKSGGTKETRNGMLETKAIFGRHGLAFARHAVAITGEGSELDRYAKAEGWLARFPMWDWVGGRTSEMSAVGLVPAALQGFDVNAMLAGAKASDDVTRQPRIEKNPAAQLAAAWFYAVNDIGLPNMVILPYKDRLELFSRYLQQLIMESLGKEFDLQGNVVHQGISVFGNKGSTDQHAYVQQLRDGPPNFCITFIDVLKDRNGSSLQVEPEVTSGDYLHGFLYGTRHALYEKGRESITITVEDVSTFRIGVLIALYERAVGIYAQLVGINAYHQPGVEAGKKAAGTVIKLQRRIIELLRKERRKFTVMELGQILQTDDLETIFRICEHLAANLDRGISKSAGKSPRTVWYEAI